MLWLGVAAIAAVGVEQVVRMGDFRVDDAYITFSYSKNLAGGNGPVYSHDLRVEGYSNFLWMVLVSFGFLVAPSSDGYWAARILGFGLLVFGLYVVYRMARRSAGPLVSLIAPAALIVCSDLTRATLSGLETTAYVVAIAFGWWVYLRESPKNRRWSLLAFVPAALMRIDGFVPVLIVGGVEVLRALHERRFSLRRLLRWAGPALLIWGAYFAWRYWYYGLPLPTTYYAKQLVDVQQPTRGYDQVWGFLREYGLLAVLPLMGLPLIRGPRVEALSLWMAVVLYVVFVGLTGGDWMPFQRFFLPALPLGAVLLAWGVARLKEELRSQPLLVRLVGSGVALAGITFYAVRVHMATLDTNEERAKIAEAKHVQSHTVDNLMAAMDLARWSVRNPGERFAAEYAGVFAVFTQAQVIDMWGLCNADIALQGGTEGINPVWAIFGKVCPRCFTWLEPDYFHVVNPLLRKKDEFTSIDQVINQIFLGPNIDGYIGLRDKFAVGRVLESSTGRAFWFLERRRPNRPLVTRAPAPGIQVDYPLEQ